jgi:hypothetical protein
LLIEELARHREICAFVDQLHSMEQILGMTTIKKPVEQLANNRHSSVCMYMATFFKNKPNLPGPASLLYPKHFQSFYAK